MRRLWLLVLVLLLSACEDAPAPEGCAPASEGAPRLVELFQRTYDGGRSALPDGADVDLTRPIQGGHVIFVAARATGLCAGNGTVYAAIRSPESGTIVSDESRSVELLDDGDGAVAPDVGNLGELANVALCPDHLGHPIDGGTYTLEVALTDASDRTARAQVTVRPACAQTDASALTQCRCECAAGGDESQCG